MAKAACGRKTRQARRAGAGLLVHGRVRAGAAGRRPAHLRLGYRVVAHRERLRARRCFAEPRPLYLDRVMRTNYRIDDFQETYFVIRDLDELLELASIDFGPLYQQVIGAPEFEPLHRPRRRDCHARLGQLPPRQAHAVDRLKRARRRRDNNSGHLSRQQCEPGHHALKFTPHDAEKRKGTSWRRHRAVADASASGANLTSGEFLGYLGLALLIGAAIGWAIAMRVSRMNFVTQLRTTTNNSSSATRPRRTNCAPCRRAPSANSNWHGFPSSASSRAPGTSRAPRCSTPRATPRRLR